MLLLAFISSATGLAIPAWVFWILGIVFLVVAQFRTYRDVRRDLAKVQFSLDQQETRRRRLLESRVLTGEAFYVWELIQPDAKPVIENRTFFDCLFKGPAMVSFIAHCNVDHFTAGSGDIDSILHEMPSPGVKQGIYGLLGCNLDRCTFQAIGIYGDKPFLDELRKKLIVI